MVTDTFYLVHRPLTGDGSITAEVTSLTEVTESSQTLNGQTRREAQMSQRISKPRSNPTFPKGRSYHVNVAEAGGEATVVMATGVGSAPSEARAGAR
jgi:hypothetical protein